MGNMQYAEMKDSGVEWIGMVPKHWDITSIKQHHSITLGKMLESEQKTDDSTYENYMCASNLKWGGIDTNVHRQMWFSPSEKQEYLLQEGDLLIMEGGLAGTSSIYHNEFAPCYIQNSVNRCRGKADNLATFLYYWMFFVYHCGHVESVCNRATIMHLTKEKLGRLAFVDVSPSEQARIVTYLDSRCSAIDDVIAQAKETIEEYKSWKASVIFEAVTKGLDPNVEMKDSGVEWIGSVPVHWEVKALKYLATCNDEVLPETTPGNFLFDYIDIGSVHTSNGIETCERMQFKDAPSRARRIVRSGDIIVSTVRTYLKAIAQVGTFDTPQIASTGFAVIRAKNASAGFLRYALLSDNFVSQVEAESVGISYPAINSSQLMTFKITLPPCEKEQTAIASYLDDKCSAIDSIIFEKQVLIGELESYKKSLIFETVTGKRRVC